MSLTRDHKIWLYRQQRPVVCYRAFKHLTGLQAYPRRLSAQVAKHIVCYATLLRGHSMGSCSRETRHILPSLPHIDRFRRMATSLIMCAPPSTGESSPALSVSPALSDVLYILSSTASASSVFPPSPRHHDSLLGLQASLPLVWLRPLARSLLRDPASAEAVGSMTATAGAGVIQPVASVEVARRC
jgi:hypothetical protein